MSGGDEEWFAPLRAKFASRLPEHRESLLAALAADDRERLVGRAHRLAGIAGMMGSAEVGQAALRLEEELRSDKVGDAAFAALIDAIDRAIG